MACATVQLRRAGISIACLAMCALAVSQALAEVKWEGRSGSETDKKSEAKIRMELATPTKMDFVETPLHDAITLFKDLHSIEIQLDSRALEDQGVGTDTPVTMQSNGVSLASALRLLLKPLELTYVVRDGVLLITTPDAASDMIELRVYDVRDLIVDDDTRDLAGSLATFLFPQPITMGGMGGGMGGMGGGGMGGMGMFAVKDKVVKDHKGAKEKSKPAAASTPAPVHVQPRHITPYRHVLLVRASIVDHERLSNTLDEMREKLKPKS